MCGVRKIQGERRAFRIRVGQYRVIYGIYEDEIIVLIVQVVRRSEGMYR